MIDESNAGQILPPERGNPVAKALRRFNSRLTGMQEHLDALQALIDAARERFDVECRFTKCGAEHIAALHDATEALEKRLDALQEAFYRHSHPDEVKGVLALNAAEEALEAKRHG